MRCNRPSQTIRATKACALLLAASVAFATALPTHAGLMFGDFEGSATGWENWIGSPPWSESLGAMPFTSTGADTTYDYSTSHATSGSQSLKVDGKLGWDLNLAYNAGAAGAPVDVADFLANDTLSFDITFAGGNPGGWNQVHQVVFNTNAGWQAIEVSFSTPDLETDQTVTATYDYSGIDFTGATYLQLILATNNNNDPTHTTYYFDNFQISSAVPEPSTLALLGLASLLGVCQRRTGRNS